MDTPPFFQHTPSSPRLLQTLPEAITHSVLVLDGYLENLGKLDGPSYHILMTKCIDNNITEPKDLDEWLQQRYSQGLKHERFFARARQRAERSLREGIWVAAWHTQRPPEKNCPQVLFGQGCTEWNRPWAAVFNSRKSKLVNFRDEWLTALRSWLYSSTLHSFGMATSLGTLTYDLVTAHAQASGTPFLLVSTAPFGGNEKCLEASLLRDGAQPLTRLTCQSEALQCSKACRMVCRDRLLAFLADIHWVLEVRDKGNLHHILETQHRQQPRQLAIRLPRKATRKNQANFKLLNDFPSAKAVANPVEATRQSDGVLTSFHRDQPRTTVWELARVNRLDYLYHYTRSCPGPWPGQSYRQYLLAILQNEPLCEHSALHTLIRILREGRIRASKKLVRGEQPVISWSAVPPEEINGLRHWNPALIRWTFDPYGIAIRRKLLRKSGAKPVVYGNEKVYAKLKNADRYRFQRHEPPDCSWKHEREWRLADDFCLDHIAPTEGFIFLPESAVGELSAHDVQLQLPVAVLSIMNGTEKSPG